MKRNRGFSLVELLVVIAIMAVLTGVLAPMLVNYINKARLSTDVDTGRKIADAIMIAVTEEGVKDNAVEHQNPHPVKNMDGNDFKKRVFELLGVSEVNGKSKKDADGNVMENGAPQFYYALDAEKNKVEVYYGGTDADYQIYPATGNKLVK